MWNFIQSIAPVVSTRLVARVVAVAVVVFLAVRAFQYFKKRTAKKDVQEMATMDVGHPRLRVMHAVSLADITPFGEKRATVLKTTRSWRSQFEDLPLFTQALGAIVMGVIFLLFWAILFGVLTALVRYLVG